MTIERKLLRVVRSTEGALLMKWAAAAVAEICDECGAPISPGEEIAVRQVPTLHSGAVRQVERTWCRGCGALLEDSLLTTEDVQ